VGDGETGNGEPSPGRGAMVHPRSNQRCRCRARATREPGSPVAQGDDAKPGGGCRRGRQPKVEVLGESSEGRERRGVIARWESPDASRHRWGRRQLAEQEEQGPQRASPVIGTDGTSGCEASAPQVGHQRPSTQRHPASQWTAKRPQSSHTHPKPTGLPGSGWDS
jgi:hypothetical protein